MATMRDIWPVEEKSTMSLAPEMTVARTADLADGAGQRGAYSASSSDIGCLPGVAEWRRGAGPDPVSSDRRVAVAWDAVRCPALTSLETASAVLLRRGQAVQRGNERC